MPVPEHATVINKATHCIAILVVIKIKPKFVIYYLSKNASLRPPIITAIAPTAPNAGFPMVKPTIEPNKPRQIATINSIFPIAVLLAPFMANWYPHDGQLLAVSETDLLHSGHSIKATINLLEGLT